MYKITVNLIDSITNFIIFTEIENKNVITQAWCFNLNEMFNEKEGRDTGIGFERLKLLWRWEGNLAEIWRYGLGVSVNGKYYYQRK